MAVIVTMVSAFVCVTNSSQVDIQYTTLLHQLSHYLHRHLPASLLFESQLPLIFLSQCQYSPQIYSFALISLSHSLRFSYSPSETFFDSQCLLLFFFQCLFYCYKKLFSSLLPPLSQNATQYIPHTHSHKTFPCL